MYDILLVVHVHDILLVVHVHDMTAHFIMFLRVRVHSNLCKHADTYMRGLSSKVTNV